MRLLLITLVLNAACFQNSLAQTAGKLCAGAFTADITSVQWPVRIMLSLDPDAATTGFRVGNESLSQFSREYRRLFGVWHPSVKLHG